MNDIVVHTDWRHRLPGQLDASKHGREGSIALRRTHSGESRGGESWSGREMKTRNRTKYWTAPLASGSMGRWPCGQVPCGVVRVSFTAIRRV